jgi:hypothetical protein
MKNVRLGMLLFLLSFVFVACNKKACERTCDCFLGEDAEADEQNECIKECEKALKEENSDCRGAFRLYARCMDRYNCEGGCGADAEEVAKKCEDMFAPAELPEWERGGGYDQNDGDEEDEEDPN